MKIILLFSYLGLAAWFDIRTKKIPILLSVVAAIVGVLVQLLYFGNNPSTLILGLLPGAVLMTVSWLSHGAIGMGDGELVGVIGLFLGIAQTATLVLGSLLLASLLSLFLLVVKRVSKRYEFPFAPLVFLMYGGVMLIG